MRKIFEWVGGFAIVAFSFYFTDKVSLLVASKSDLMQEIKAVSAEYEMKPVDAIIDDEANTIVPGQFGRKVNNQESYLSMHDFGSFNENYLVYDYVKPQKSLEDNKDKYIMSGNKNNRQVSLIVVDNDDVSKFLVESNIPFDQTTDGCNVEKANSLIELINTSTSKDKFNALSNRLKDKAKICLKDRSDEVLCKKNGYYIIDAHLKLTGTNLIEIKNALEPGSIILLTPTAKTENIKMILNEIEYKDLQIVHISKLIDEKERGR